MPRLVGHGKHAINYRHVIDSLVRKPGAFENYQYREDMFPTSHFRMAYDWLCQRSRVPAGGRPRIPEDSAIGGPGQPGRGAGRAAFGHCTRTPPSPSKAVRLAVEQHQQVPASDGRHRRAAGLAGFRFVTSTPRHGGRSYEHENDEANRKTRSPATKHAGTSRKEAARRR